MESLCLSANMKIIIAFVFLCAYASVANLQEISKGSGPTDTDVQVESDNTAQNMLEDQGDVLSTRSCQPDMCRLLGEMGAMVTRLVASERMIQKLEAVVTQQKSAIEDLRSMVTQQKSAIEDLRSMVTQQKSTIAEQSRAFAQQGSIVSELGSMVEQLNVEVRNRPKVAFSASLYSSGNKIFGPFPGDTNLVFRTVFTNDGDAYSPATGIFRAPIKGVYYIRFTAFSTGKAARRVSLLKNGQPIVTITDNESSNYREESSSNAAVLELDQGDEVHLVLRAYHHVYDDQHHHTTFSGFLLHAQS
ncbi:hypothetical protein ACEWY4_001474 [Coilia grayii]|uniref:C1q domain-containing protein n=1 Tax=Coilia grayii TaxID=363190 RepID=A0ABD1KTG0_9TELE